MKIKSTKSALLMSFTSLLLCFAMLIGCTFAWFTDSVTSGVNKIVAGNLDVEVEYSKDGTNWANLQDSASLFTGALWEPGHTEYVTLKIVNKGTLALKYQVNVSPINEKGGINMAGESFKLSDYLVFGTKVVDGTTGPTYADRDAARAAVGNECTPLSQTYLNSDAMKRTGELMAKTSETEDIDYITLVVYMPESVGNEANYKTGTAAPEIDLGITVVATQLQNESDSFGIDYDGSAAYDADKAAIVYNYFPQVSQSATFKKVGDKATSTDANVTVTDDGDVTIKSSVKVSEVTGKSDDNGKNFASVEIPSEIINTLVNDDKDHVIALNVNKDDTANATFKMQVDAPDLTDKETTTYEVNVTMDGVKVNTTSKLYTVKMFIGENKQNLKMYHNNDGMTKVTDTPDADNEYNYNPTDGYVTMCVNSFSPFTSVYDEPVAAIGTTVYYSLESAIAAANNETIVLLKNIDNAVGISVPSGKNFTVDFNGHTYTASAPAAGSTGTKNQAFQLLKDSTIVFKNGTIKIGEGNSAGLNPISRMIQNYANLTLENMTFDDTNLALREATVTVKDSVMEFDNGVVSIKNTTIKASNGRNAFAVETWPAGGYSDGAQVTVEDSTINGSIRCYSEIGGCTGYTKSSLTIKSGTMNGNFVDSNPGHVVISITGGTFSSNPTEHVAPNYHVIDNGNGTWTVNDGVAQIVETGTKYNSLADAIAAATTGQTIKMLCDTEYTDVGFELKDVNLDLGGYTMKVTRSAKDYGKIQLLGRVTVKNGSFEGSMYSAGAGIIYVDEDADATVENVNITSKYGDKPAYGVANYSGTYMQDPNGTLVINSGIFNCYVGTNGSTRQGAMTINGGTFNEGVYFPAYMNYTINGGTFNNYVEFRSGTINITGGAFNYVDDTKIEFNEKKTDVNIEGYSIDLVGFNGPIGNSGDKGYGPTPVLTITGGTFAGKIGLCRMAASYDYPTVTATGVTVETVNLGVDTAN